MGDPAGIGPEVVLKALARASQKAEVRMQKPAFRVVGSIRVFEQERKRLGLKVDLGCVDDSVPSPGRFRMGRAQESCGRAAFEALATGVSLLRNGEVSALVTAPVSKEALRLAGFRWPGQTEFLAERLGAKRHAMLAWTPRFKVAFVTIHEPLGRVSRLIAPALIAEKARLLADFLCAEGTARPRICVMAFNPHAYEFSCGEEERIAEGVARARRAGVDAIGPIPADAATTSLSTSRILAPPDPRTLSYDGYVAMYHDQAMIPAKLLGRDAGVNVTLGLGRVRTSPLHGTASDIAGRGVASPGSMLAAIRLARRLARLPAGSGQPG
ncbi:4-hydroxythreonine-4-phosphate dehydrogenase PdxA [candidate division WOR-3 bacterium]|nr:4-hydroxythreonine-4-phosphate dehydrogenase PdxA [candidate division WOR-3 bacterium]